MNVIIYVRVSKQIQDYQRQVSELTEYASKQNWNVVKVIAEKISGAKNNEERKGITQLLEEVKNNAVKKVLVSEVSRLGRKTSEVLNVIEELTALKVSVFALNYGLETLTHNGKQNPMASLIFTLLAEFAKLERETTIDRINSGLDEARRKGIKLGRKEGSVKTDKQFLKENKRAIELLKKNQSIRNVAKICDLSTNTVLKIKKLLADK